MLNEALEYCAAGLKVLPLYSRMKTPALPNGFLDASSDEEIVRLFWRGNRDANVGIVIPKNWVVVDVDDVDSIKLLEESGNMLPPTLESTSGSGGRHLIYKLAGKTTTSRRISYIPGIDILVNGYIVAPPSVHPNGCHYTWNKEFSIDEVAAAPSWLATCERNYAQDGDTINPDKILEGVKPGHRQTALFRYACQLRGRGSSVKEAKLLVRSVADSSGSGDYDTDKLVDRVYKKYKGRDDDASSIKVWTLAELQSANLPSPKYLAYETVKGGKRGFIPVGVNIITSASKVGKSAFAGLAASKIAAGEPLLGFETERTGVLYLDLEQDDTNAKQRWLSILGEDNGWPANLRVAFEWKRMDDGGIEMIEKFLYDNVDVGFVIVDTLADIWPTEDTGGGNAYHVEQRVFSRFHKLFLNTGVAILLVHHDSKAGNKSIARRGSGTMAVSGKPHGLFALDREDGSSLGVLSTKGKNIPERVIKLYYEQDKCLWRLVD